jgi:hypothetical protein
VCLRGELADYVLMEGRGFGFITFSDPAGAQTFLEVNWATYVARTFASQL